MSSQSTPTSLGESFPKMQAHVREVLKQYHELGAAGVLGSMVIEQVLQRADAAAISGDVVEMLRSYKEMEGVE